MKNYFFEEFYRAFASKKTLISVLLCIICIFVGSAESMFTDERNNAFNLFMLSYSEGTNAVLGIVFPVIVCIPFASSYVQDVQSGFINYVYLRIGRIKYIIIRLIINCLVGGCVISVSLLVSFFAFATIKGINTSFINSTIIVFNDIYHYNPIYYVLIIIVNSFVCGAIFSTVGLGLSTFILNRYFAIIAPFLFYILSGTFLLQINRFFNAAIIYDLNHYGDLTFSNVIIYDFSLFILSAAILVVGANRNREKII